MRAIEINGVFARIADIAHAYGRLTKQEHIAYAEYFGLSNDCITVVYKDRMYDEYEHGKIPLLAFVDLDAAVQEYTTKKEEERAKKEQESEQWERGQYMRLKAKYEKQ